MIIDAIEKGALEELGILLVIHMDPIETKDQDILKIQHLVEEYLSERNILANIHDFRVSYGSQGRVDIFFDMIVPHSYTEKEEQDLLDDLIFYLKNINLNYHCVITLEHSFVYETALLGNEEE